MCYTCVSQMERLNSGTRMDKFKTKFEEETTRKVFTLLRQPSRKKRNRTKSKHCQKWDVKCQISNVNKIKLFSERFCFSFCRCHEHTSCLSFFPHRQTFGLNFSLHRKCINRDKTGFATIQRKLQLKRFSTNQHEYHPCHSLNYITFYASSHPKKFQISNFSTSKLSPHLVYLHM